MRNVIPQALCDRVKLLRKFHSQREVRDITGVSTNAIMRMERRGFVEHRGGPPSRPLPPDFTVMANRMTSHELRKHYRASGPTIQRWLALVQREYITKAGRHARPELLSRTSLIAVLARHRTKQGAADELGVSIETLRVYRRKFGLPIEQQEKGQRRAAPIADRSFGWAERMFAERQAA